MAHRGRLNVLSQVMGKPHRVIFHEFKGGSASPDEVEGSGDVKYHLGASSDREFDGNSVHLSLTANPSHLEIVDPVVLGKVRAKQDQLNDYIERVKVMPVLIHGDAAFAGPGRGRRMLRPLGPARPPHRRLAAFHRQQPDRLHHLSRAIRRSSPYPSDVAKLVEAPIFHVNGDDPEAVVFCAKVATEYRQKFHKPVVIDMFCYRRFGHNEGDEPAFTQPLMYRNIRSHPTTLQIYAKKLVEEGVVTQGEVDKMRGDWRHRLEAEFEAGQAYVANKADWLDGRWAGVKRPRRTSPTTTAAARPAVDAEQAEVLRRAHHQRARGLRGPQDDPALPRQSPQRDPVAATASTGRPARRSLSPRCSTRAFPFACPVRTASAARSRSAIRC